MNIKDRITKVLDSTHLMSLATFDDGGLWVADVIFIYDDNFNLYWISDPAARHSQAVLQDNQVAGTITFSTKSKEPNFGIQFSGLAEKIDGPRYDLAVKHLQKRSHPIPNEKDDVLQGDSWYMLKPTRIELIDEENLGYEKEILNL